MKLEHKECWYRIFIDAGVCFCERYKFAKYIDVYTEDIDNCENCPTYQIDRRFSLQGLTIVSTLVYPYNVFHGVELKIVFHNGDYLAIQEARDSNAENSLSIIKV